MFKLLEDKFIKLIKRILCCFVVSGGLRDAIREGKFDYYIQAKRLMKHEYTCKGRDVLAIIAMIRNEGPYLAEWIEYHKLIGVSRFYIFDNESTDNTRTVLDKYIKSGLVIYEYVSDNKLEKLGKKYSIGPKSHVAHWLAIEKCRKNNTKWVAIIDVDEFLVPKQDKTVIDFLKRFSKKTINQIIIGWEVFGSSGHIKKPKGLVIENYTHKGKIDETRAFKAIVKPKSIVVDKNHYHAIFGKTVDETGKVLYKNIQSYVPPTNVCVCNHYITRSKEECINKCKKNQSIHGGRYTEKFFETYDKNDVLDETMLQYVPIIKKSMKGDR